MGRVWEAARGPNMLRFSLLRSPREGSLLDQKTAASSAQQQPPNGPNMYVFHCLRPRILCFGASWGKKACASEQTVHVFEAAPEVLKDTEPGVKCTNRMIILRVKCEVDD